MQEPDVRSLAAVAQPVMGQLSSFRYYSRDYELRPSDSRWVIYRAADAKEIATLQMRSDGWWVSAGDGNGEWIARTLSEVLEMSLDDFDEFDKL